MSNRKTIPKAVRFEVFKRDKFTCQYCGQKAPDVVLNADHIKPVAEGGTNDIVNLITSCEPCNNGKGARSLGDDSAVAKSRAQMELLQERREQIEMMMQWQVGLVDIDNQAVDVVMDVWWSIAPGFTPNPQGRALLRKWIKAYGIEEVIAAMNVCSKYIEFSEGKATSRSWEEGFNKILTVCKSRKMERDNPELAQAYHLRNIFCSVMRRKGKTVTGHYMGISLDHIRKCQAAGWAFEDIAKAIAALNVPSDIVTIFVK